jgi:hypothetical protein
MTIIQQENKMAEIIQFISRSELERVRLIRKARATYDSIFPTYQLEQAGQANAGHTGGNASGEGAVR